MVNNEDEEFIQVTIKQGRLLPQAQDEHSLVFTRESKDE